MADREQLEQAIAAQESLRGLVEDDVIDVAVAALRRQLEASSAEPQRRRQVTVLFADLSGFTAMSARLDPEAVASVMNELWARLDAVVVEHGGRVDKHIGDAVMAVWGAEATREDDPERAVRAALAINEELERRTAGEGLAMRIGINTGPVYLGGVGASTEFTAMGDAVNVASRVQGMAPLAGTLVTHDTYRHVRGVFDVEELGPTTLKGKDAPVRLYLVLRAKTRAFRMHTRGVEGVETQMIGRAGELALLRAEFEQVVEQPAARRAMVIGDAGIGKSRLLYELESRIDLHPATAYFFAGRALPTRRSVPFGLVRDLLGDRFGVLDSDPPSVVAEKVRAGLGPTLTTSEADLVGHWLGFDFRTSAAVQGLLGSGQLATTARAHLLRYLEALAADMPVVLFLEDLHWADDESLTLVDELVAELVAAHVLIVGVARPSLLERPVADGLLERCSVALHLSPLGAEATRALVAEVLQKADRVPDELVDLIAQRADGNAFFVEELVKMLIEDGVIEAGEPWDPWQVHLDRLDAGRVPATLAGVLQARLDSLAASERDALQRSSVVGRVFWDAAVASLGPDGIEATARSLEGARARELVFRREHSSFDDCVEYSFKHALLREVTYETVLLRDRQRLHRLVARWITESAGERVVEYAGLIAAHHRLAGDLGSAADLLGQAGVAALDAGNAAGARRSFDEALELWRDAGAAAPPAALTAMAEACVRLGDLRPAARFADEALRLATTADERGNACYVASWIASEQGDRDREQALLEAALPHAEELGGLLLSRVLAGLGWSAVNRQDDAAAATYAERLQELSRQLQHPAASRRLLSLLALLATRAGDVRGSMRHSREALAVAVASGDLEGQSLAHGNLGVAYHLLGDDSGSHDDYMAALDHYERARSIDRRLGRRIQEGMAAANIGQLNIRLGDDASARRLIHEALTILREAGGTSSLLFAALAEADRRLTNGDAASALELIGVVQRHPAVTSHSGPEIESILRRSDLPPDVIEHGLAVGAGQDFDTMIDRVMADLSNNPSPS